MAPPSRSRTTFTTDVAARSAALRSGVTAVAIDQRASAFSFSASSSTSAGSINGSSPCTFTSMSSSAKSPPRYVLAAQAMRSVPLGRSDGVMTALPPCSSTARTIRSSSVATSTSSNPRALPTASTTHATSGLPAMSARGLPGNRLDPKRDGIIAYVLMDEDYTINSRARHDIGSGVNSPCSGGGSEVWNASTSLRSISRSPKRVNSR